MTVALALLAPVAASAAEPALIPADYFAQASIYSLANLAPDGKHLAVAVTTERDGAMTPTLTVYAVPELKHVSTIALPGHESLLYEIDAVTAERTVRADIPAKSLMYMSAAGIPQPRYLDC